MRNFSETPRRNKLNFSLKKFNLERSYWERWFLCYLKVRSFNEIPKHLFDLIRKNREYRHVPRMRIEGSLLYGTYSDYPRIPVFKTSGSSRIFYRMSLKYLWLPTTIISLKVVKSIFLESPRKRQDDISLESQNVVL